jgi:C4-type Zn-finger protein
MPGVGERDFEKNNFEIKEMKKEILNTVNAIETIVNKMSPSDEVMNCIGKAVEGENAVTFMTEDFGGTSILPNSKVRDELSMEFIKEWKAKVEG